MIYGGAWSHNSHVHLHQDMGFDWWYSSDAATALADGTFIPIWRPNASPGGYQWDDDFTANIPWDYNGYALFLNEPDLLSQDAIKPQEAMEHLVTCLSRWPKAKWIGPNTWTSDWDKMSRATKSGLRVQKDWLHAFINLWLKHGWPVKSAYQMPFHAWGFHLYDSTGRGKQYALDHFQYLENMVTKPRTVNHYGQKVSVSMPFNRVWITEAGTYKPDIMTHWLDVCDSLSTTKRFAGFWLWASHQEPQKTKDYAFYLGSDEKITPLGTAVKQYIKGN
jgi:hypothetical protein